MLLAPNIIALFTNIYCRHTYIYVSHLLCFLFCSEVFCIEIIFTYESIKCFLFLRNNFTICNIDNEHSFSQLLLGFELSLVYEVKAEDLKWKSETRETVDGQWTTRASSPATVMEERGHLRVPSGGLAGLSGATLHLGHCSQGLVPTFAPQKWFCA